MKALIKFTAIIGIAVLLVGCTEKKDDLSYETFRNDFFEFASNFKPEGFYDISDDMYTSVTASYPENKLNDKKVDAVNDDLTYPYRYETYYMSEDDIILVKVNFIYYPQSKEKGFITLYSIGQNLNANIEEEYREIERPEITEFLISFDGYIVLLHFIDLDLEYRERNNLGEDHLLRPRIRNSFYEQFENELLKIIENR